jgi:hypothetical protein
MRESACAPEVVTPRAQGVEGFSYVVSADGHTALIDVVDGERHGVWRVPIERLPWALALFPVHLKPLPPLESDCEREIRLLTQKLGRNSWRMTDEEKSEAIGKLNELELERVKVGCQTRRFCLTKFLNGIEWYVHRLYVREFVDATMRDRDIVEPLDGDWLNYATTTLRYEHRPTGSELCVRRGDRPLVENVQLEAQNLQIVKSSEAQEKFENKGILQTIETPEGEPVETPLVVQPNVLESWATAGRHKITKEVIEAVGRGNIEIESDKINHQEGEND